MSLEPRDSAEIEQYILHAVDLIAEHALYRDRVHWDEVRDRARRTARGAKCYAGTHRLLRQVLKEAGGRHSYLKLPYQYPRPGATASGSAQASLSPDAKTGPALPDGELLDRVAVLRGSRSQRLRAADATVRGGGPRCRAVAGCGRPARMGGGPARQHRRGHVADAGGHRRSARAWSSRLLRRARWPSAGMAAPAAFQPVAPAAPQPVGFRNSAIVPDLDFYAARSYSLIRPPRTGQRLIRSWERSAGG
jgi:hypothetical protein